MLGIGRDTVTDVVVIGAGGFGRTVAAIIHDVNADGGSINLIGLIDDQPSSQQAGLADSMGVEHLGDLSALDRVGETTRFLVASGNGSVRRATARKVSDGWNLEPLTLVHPSAYVARSAEIGAGSIVRSES